jgi:hypothetical protein
MPSSHVFSPNEAFQEINRSVAPAIFITDIHALGCACVTPGKWNDQLLYVCISTKKVCEN